MTNWMIAGANAMKENIRELAMLTIDEITTDDKEHPDDALEEIRGVIALAGNLIFSIDQDNEEAKESYGNCGCTMDSER